MQIIQKIALCLTIIGGINWGLIGFLDFNLVATIFSNVMLQRIIYSLVGISSIINIALLFKDLDHEIEK